MAFIQADADGNGVLSFDEFKDCFATLKKSGEAGVDMDEHELRTLFEEMDANVSGDISMDEYFIWSLGVASQHGGGLESVFKKYDSDGSGMLDMIEFALAIEELGFEATFASEIFLELDDDNSGSVSYSEISTTLRARMGSISAGTKKFLTSLAFQGVERQPALVGSGLGAIKRIDTSSWMLTGPDEESLRNQIHHELVRNSLRDNDLYHIISMPPSGSQVLTVLTQDAFVEALQRLGFSGPQIMLKTVFKHLDVDGSGVIGPTELHDWMTGRLTRKLKARGAHLASARADGFTVEHLEWTPESLRREIVIMLQRLNLAELDLIRAWDTSESGSSDGFSHREFVVMMKSIIRPPAETKSPIWYNSIKPVVESIFRHVAGNDTTIDVIEFVRWLNEEWRRQRIAARLPPGGDSKGEKVEEQLPSAKHGIMQGSTDSNEEKTSQPRHPTCTELVSLDQLYYQGVREASPSVNLPSCTSTRNTSSLKRRTYSDLKTSTSSTNRPLSSPGFAQRGRLRSSQSLTAPPPAPPASAPPTKARAARTQATASASPRTLRIRGCVEHLADELKATAIVMSRGHALDSSPSLIRPSTQAAAVQNAYGGSAARAGTTK